LLERALANGRVHYVCQRVACVEREGKGWCLRTAAGETLSADFLVGADGVRSLVRKEVVGPIPRAHLGLGVGYRVQGTPDNLIFQTFADLEGYLWSFPRPGGASVGIGSRLGSMRPRDLWQRLDTFLNEEHPEAKKEKHWAGLLPMARDPSLWDAPCVSQDWALLGDAAGHVHPLNGEGIAYALWSAELLAEALEHGEPQLYESRWRQEYGSAMMAASAVLSSAGSGDGRYELIFQLAMAMAF